MAGHAWGWIPEVDEKGISRGSDEWNHRWNEHTKVVRERDLNFKGRTWKRSLMNGSLVDSDYDGAMADLRDDRDLSLSGSMNDTPIYDRMHDFVLDNQWVLEDDSFDWSDWQMAALTRGYNITDNADK
jgi:hypothetical protein